MKYNISDIANLLGISVVAVRNYEKSGLIDPERDEQNNYRRYNAIDINLIRRARAYTSYGFSLSEATNLLQEAELAGMAHALKQKETEMEAQLLRDYQKYLFTRQHAAYLERISASGRECSIEVSPTFYGILYREQTEIFQDKCLHEIVSEWNDIRPFAETMIFFQRDAFINRNNRYQSGLCIEEAYAQQLNIEESKYIRRYPSQKAVHTIIQSVFEPEKVISEFEFDYVLKWIQDKGFTISGDVVGRILHTSKASGKWLHHVEIWVPIK